MIRLNLAWWCRVASGLSELALVRAGDPFPEFYAKTLPPAGVIWANHSESALVRLSSSQEPAFALLGHLAKMRKDGSRTDPITNDEAAELQKLVRDYQVVLEAELGVIDAYYVTQKGIFSTRHLIENAEAILPAEMQASLSDDARADLRAGGRCLAFELPTAAGFHIARATETVITWFMGCLGCPVPKDSQRNWGVYIKALKDKGADAKITTHLEQLKDLHRNPLVHPEESLTAGEALLFLSACTGLVAAMVTEGEKAKAILAAP